MSARQTWQMLCPPEPGPEVTCVRAAHGDLWDRAGTNGWAPRLKNDRVSLMRYCWELLVLTEGPLHDATTPANVPPAQPRGSAR